MTASPLVTILIPFYNPGDFFDATLRSLEKLVYDNIEFIFIDDGSFDESHELLRSFKKSYRLIRQSNKGVLRLAETLNVGLGMANGKYVQMFPSDDIIYANKLQAQVSILEKMPDVVLVFSDMDIIDESGVKKAISYSPRQLKGDQSYGLSELREHFLLSYFLSQPTTLIRKETLLGIGGFIQPDGLYAEDMPTHLELLKHGRFYYAKNCTAGYRIHSQQMTNRHALAMLVSDFVYIKKWARQNTDETRHNVRLRLLLLWKSYFVLFRVLVSNIRGARPSILNELSLSVYNPLVYLVILSAFPIFLAKKKWPDAIRYRFRRTCKP